MFRATVSILRSNLSRWSGVKGDLCEPSGCCLTGAALAADTSKSNDETRPVECILTTDSTITSVSERLLMLFKNAMRGVICEVYPRLKRHDSNAVAGRRRHWIIDALSRASHPDLVHFTTRVQASDVYQPPVHVSKQTSTARSSCFLGVSSASRRHH